MIYHVYGHYESYDDRRCDFDKAITIQSQIMMKLKPMKSPSTPPQSATREPKEKASSSLITCIESLPNDGARLETGRGYFDFSMICNRKRGERSCLHDIKNMISCQLSPCTP